MKRTIVWPAVIAATLAVVSIASSTWNSAFSLSTGLAGVVSAILSTRD